MDKMEKKDYIVEIIKTWDENDIINAWNRTCEENNDPDSMIYCTADFDELFCGKKPSEIAEMIQGTHFSTYDEYFTFNNYGNIESFSSVNDDESPVLYDEIAEYLINYGDSDTEEVDTDNLQEYFLDWVKFEYPDMDIEKAKHIIEEEEDFDFLTEEWSDIADNILNYKEDDSED